jgi:hypothetical protein
MAMKNRRIAILSSVVLVAGLGSAWAQIVVTDRLTTARNAMVAALKTQIVDVARAQHERLRDMARRLGVGSLARYAVPEAPPSDADTSSALTYGESYRTALRYGDASGSAFEQWARTRQPAGDLLTDLSPEAREAIERGLATLDVTDSSLIVATHHVGAMRARGGHELRAIDTLESDVIDPSDAQSATAVLDKISAASLLETQQKQARVQHLTSLVEQLTIDNKRARDTEAALLNMQLRRLLHGGWDEGQTGMLDGAANDLRTWRQP